MTSIFHHRVSELGNKLLNGRRGVKDGGVFGFRLMREFLPFDDGLQDVKDRSSLPKPRNSLPGNRTYSTVALTDVLWHPYTLDQLFSSRYHWGLRRVSLLNNTYGNDHTLRPGLGSRFHCTGILKFEVFSNVRSASGRCVVLQEIWCCMFVLRP